MNKDRLDRITARVARLVEMELVGTARRALQLLLDRYELVDDLPVRCLLAECLLASGDYSSALEQLASNDQNISTRYLRSYCLALSGEPREALRIAVSQLRACPTDSPDTADLLVCMGVALYRTGHYKWGAESFERAAAIFLLAGKRTRYARCLMSLALIDKNLGRHQAALHRLDQATTLISGKRLPRTRMALLLNRGVCSLQLGKLTESRTYFIRAETLAREAHNSFVLISIHNNLGHIYRMMGNFKLAAEFYESALEGAIREKVPRKECLSLEFLAENLIETGDHVRALGLLNRAYSIAVSSSGYGDLIGEIIRRRGEAHWGERNLSDSRRDIEKALRICRSRGERREELCNCLVLCGLIPLGQMWRRDRRRSGCGIVGNWAFSVTHISISPVSDGLLSNLSVLVSQNH
jgi:tetratricopeptide (TPR) repeat protein